MKVMATVRYFWHGFIHKGTTFMYLQYSRSPLFITFCQMFGKRHTPSAHSSLWMFRTDSLIARISSSLVLYRVPRSTSFTLANRSQSSSAQEKTTILGGTESYHSSWKCKYLHRCCCHGPLVPLATGHSGTSTLLTRYRSMWLRSFRQSERTTARTRYNTRDELIHAIGWSIRNINKDGRADGVRCLPNIWQKVINKDADGLCWRYINFVPLWIKPCCHYFLLVLWIDQNF